MQKTRGTPSSRYVVGSSPGHLGAGDVDNADHNDDPGISAARERVRALKAEYRQLREEGNKGKLQMALLDYDVAVQELNDLEIQRMKRNKQTSKSAKYCLVACLPCMLCFQFFCCVSTAATGEYSKKQKINAAMREELGSLASDFIATKKKKKKNNKRRGR